MLVSSSFTAYPPRPPAQPKLTYLDDYPQQTAIASGKDVMLEAYLDAYAKTHGFHFDFNMCVIFCNRLEHSVVVETRALFESMADSLPQAIYDLLLPEFSEERTTILIDYVIGEKCYFRIRCGSLVHYEELTEIFCWHGPYTEVFTDHLVLPSLLRAIIAFASLQKNKQLADFKMRIDMRLPPDNLYQAHQLPRMMLPKPELCRFTLGGNVMKLFPMTHVPTCRSSLWYLRCNFDPPSFTVKADQDYTASQAVAPLRSYILDHKVNLVFCFPKK